VVVTEPDTDAKATAQAMATRPRVRKMRTWLLDNLESLETGDVVLVVICVALMVLMLASSGS
jgi:hypothetical protein